MWVALGVARKRGGKFKVPFMYVSLEISNHKYKFEVSNLECLKMSTVGVQDYHSRLSCLPQLPGWDAAWKRVLLNE